MRTSNNNSYCLKIYFHIIRKSNGTGGQSIENVEEAFNILNQDFNAHNISFNKDNQTSLDWANDWTAQQFQQFVESLENKYYGIFDFYTRYDWNTSTPSGAQHQQMASYYRDIIKQALTDYDPTLTDAQKDALSWIGLNSANIVAWQNLTSSERTTINSSISTIQNTFPTGCN